MYLAKNILRRAFTTLNKYIFNSLVPDYFICFLYLCYYWSQLYSSSLYLIFYIFCLKSFTILYIIKLYKLSIFLLLLLFSILFALSNEINFSVLFLSNDLEEVRIVFIKYGLNFCFYSSLTKVLNLRFFSIMDSQFLIYTCTLFIIL